ncbi:MAG: OmpA family protein [Kofleriaceae bacterium]
MSKTTLAALITAAALGTPALAAGAAGNDSSGNNAYFAFDSSALDATALNAINAMTRHANEQTSARIVLDAHCDPIGTGPYNTALAIKRAEAVRDALIANGVDKSRIVFQVYGKDGAPSATYSEDRRVHMSLSTDSIASLIDQTFDGGGTAVTWDKPLSIAQIDAPVGESVASR